MLLYRFSNFRMETSVASSAAKVAKTNALTKSHNSRLPEITSNRRMLEEAVRLIVDSARGGISEGWGCITLLT